MNDKVNICHILNSNFIFDVYFEHRKINATDDDNFYNELENVFLLFEIVVVFVDIYCFCMTCPRLGSESKLSKIASTVVRR